MYTNKNINSNPSYLTTNHTNPNYSSTSSPITIPCSTNRLSRFYIHNPLRNEQNRFIDLDLGYNNSIESAENPIYATVESPPQKIGSSIFYLEHESESFETVSSTLSETDDEQNLYEDLDIAPPLPPRNSFSTMSMDTNPSYVSSDDLRPASLDSEPIYEEIPPALPSRNFTEPNPCYVSHDILETPPIIPVRTPSFHDRFRQRFSFWPR